MILLRSICQSEVLTTRKWIVIMQKSNNSCMKHKGVCRTMSDIWDEAFCEKKLTVFSRSLFSKAVNYFRKTFHPICFRGFWIRLRNSLLYFFRVSLITTHYLLFIYENRWLISKYFPGVMQFHHTSRICLKVIVWFVLPKID